MYQDPKLAVIQIAKFLNLQYNEEIVQKVVQNSSIDEMRAKASIGLNHLRKGGYGGWRSYFTVALNENFDEVFLVLDNLLFNLVNFDADISPLHEKFRTAVQLWS